MFIVTEREIGMFILGFIWGIINSYFIDAWKEIVNKGDRIE